MIANRRLYSASFNNINPNFSIDNLPVKKKIEEPLNALFAVVSNILNRDVRIIPFGRLKRYDTEGSRNDIEYTFTEERPIWTTRTIGGGMSNPAYDFYTHELEKILEEIFPGDGRTLFNSFLPECPMRYIVNKIRNDGSTRTDFYSPILEIDIEIDGKQHSDTGQRISDQERNNLLREVGVDVIRIRTDNPNYTALKESLRRKKLNWDYDLRGSFTDINEVEANDVNLMYAIRFQMLIVELLLLGHISVNDEKWTFDIKTSEDCDNDVFLSAYEDIIDLMGDVSSLMGLEINRFPVLMIAETDGAIKVDISVNSNYSEICNDQITIRNDYFLYHQDADMGRTGNGADIFHRYKNHFTARNGMVRYNISKDDVSKDKALLNILKRCFHFDSFVNRQRDIIISCLNGRGTIGIMPTSAGKSLCYQLCSLLLPGSTLVISPLKALMEDQYSSLIGYGIGNVSYLNSDTKKIKTETVFNNRSLITLISPERFFDTQFTSFLMSGNVDYKLIVIDEVHCLSEWGHDFRTSYLCLMHSFKQYFDSEICLVGLTATASPNVAEDVLNEFNNFKEGTQIIQSASLDRVNLRLHPICVDDIGTDKWSWFEKNILGRKDILQYKTVIFTPLKTDNKSPGCKYLCKITKHDPEFKDGVVNYFCGGGETADDESQSNSQKMNLFKEGKIKILFATKAFGMGVNIVDIRNTVHYCLPNSLESLYQEFGRAGRDGQTSDCYILFNKEKDSKIRLLEKKDVMINDLGLDWNEFDSIMYLFETSNNDVEVDMNSVEHMMDYLTYCVDDYEKGFSVTDYLNWLMQTHSELYNKLDGDTAKALIEKSLYKLLLLGQIEMWSMKYSEDLFNPSYYSLRLTNASVSDSITRLENYIGRYEKDYSYSGPPDFMNVLRALLEWCFNNFVMSRIESMRLLYNYCYDNRCSDGRESKDLMKAITDFLTIDRSLYEIHNVSKSDMWFKYIDRNDPLTRSRKIDRFYESSYRSEGLNYISSMTYLQLNENEDIAYSRMDDALAKISEYPDDEIDNVIAYTFRRVDNNEQNEQLSEMFIKHFPGKLKRIYTESCSDTAGLAVIKRLSDKIKELEATVNDRC